MKEKLLSSLLFVFIIFLFTGCSDEDPNNDESFIEITVGEDVWEPTTLTSVLTDIPSLNGHRYDIFASNEDYRVSVSIAETSTSDCLSARDYTATGDNLDEVLVFFSFNVNGNFFGVHNDKKDPFDDSEESDVIVTITSCSGDKISGTFSGTFYTEIEIPDDIVPQEVIISGEFKNLSFMRQEI